MAGDIGILPALFLLSCMVIVRCPSSPTSNEQCNSLRQSLIISYTNFMAGISADEIVEHTLAQIQECYLFELPPRVRAKGWLASDMTKQLWTGRLRVVQRGEEAAIMLVDRRDGKLFAICKVEDGAVERVPDSSRYFVIKIQNAQGRHAFVGLAFDDRNQAFDFNVALQEFKKDIERTAMLSKGERNQDGTERGGDEPPFKAADLSLKQGQTIKISIGGSKTSSRAKKVAGGGSGIGGGALTLAPPPGDTARKKGRGGGGLLAPPPGDTRRARGIGLARTSPASTLTTGGPPSLSSQGSSFVFPASTTATPSAAAPALSSSLPGARSFSPVGGDGVRGKGTGEAWMHHAGGGGGGLLGMLSGGDPAGDAGVPVAYRVPATTKGEDDDDPFGLGLGSTATPAGASPPLPLPQQQQQQFSEFSAPPQQQGGLSNMSGLGAGLPSVGGVGSAPLLQTPGLASQQQTLAYSQDLHSQPQVLPPGGGGGGQTGFTSGVIPSGTSVVPKKTVAADDPFHGLF